MKKVKVFSVDFNDESGDTHLGLFSDENVAIHVSKGNGAYSKDADVTPKEIIIFETAEEFVAHSGKKVLSVEEIKQRLIERALTKLTDEEKQALGY